MLLLLLLLEQFLFKQVLEMLLHHRSASVVLEADGDLEADRVGWVAVLVDSEVDVIVSELGVAEGLDVEVVLLVGLLPDGRSHSQESPIAVISMRVLGSA